MMIVLSSKERSAWQEAEQTGYWIDREGPSNLGQLFRAWCAENDRPFVRVERLRDFDALAKVELDMIPCGARLLQDDLEEAEKCVVIVEHIGRPDDHGVVEMREGPGKCGAKGFVERSESLYFRAHIPVEAAESLARELLGIGNRRWEAEEYGL